MTKVFSETLWNGNVSEVHIEDNQIITRDVMPAKNVQAILDANHEKRSLGPNRKANTRLVASVPITIHQEWVKEWKKSGGHEDWMKFVRRKLNDPANKFLRTTEGTI